MNLSELRQRELVRSRSRYACEYCRLPECLAGGSLTQDHIFPPGQGGADEPGNLCWCCWCCNIRKGTCTEGVDPVSGKTVPLFNPRSEKWDTHFRWSRDGLRIIGRTATGRATVDALRLNDPDRVETREFWVE
ncbi:MAG: HNH endonuclease [Armatimonadetes bacterium]|nr:HNH endonuclease [Armatimonadota bacterium]